MALRDQPYIPLYIQDFLTDEKLIECSAATTGVYVRIMCIMHKSEDYGKILLKQKDKQSNEQEKNFALKLTKQMPYPDDVVLFAVRELLAEKVLTIDGDFLCQKRMIKDNQLSLVRANAGSKGGKVAQAKPKPKGEPNSENENVIEFATEGKNEIVNEDERESKIVKGKLEVFEELFSDDQFIEGLSMTHKGKDLKQAFEECYIHHSNAPNPPRELWQWRQKFNTWLSIKKTEKKNGKGFTDKREDHLTGLAEDFAKRHSGGTQ